VVIDTSVKRTSYDPDGKRDCISLELAIWGHDPEEPDVWAHPEHPIKLNGVPLLILVDLGKALLLFCVDFKQLAPGSPVLHLEELVAVAASPHQVFDVGEV